MKYTKGFALSAVLIAFAVVLVASAFWFKREAVQNTETATTTASTTIPVDEEKPKTIIPPKGGGTITVTPDNCDNRCAANEECRQELACAPCAPNTPPEYGNLCTCETVYNCVLK